MCGVLQRCITGSCSAMQSCIKRPFCSKIVLLSLIWGSKRSRRVQKTSWKEMNPWRHCGKGVVRTQPSSLSTALHSWGHCPQTNTHTHTGAVQSDYKHTQRGCPIRLSPEVLKEWDERKTAVCTQRDTDSYWTWRNQSLKQTDWYHLWRTKQKKTNTLLYAKGLQHQWPAVVLHCLL